jgi:hypothetical protein
MQFSITARKWNQGNVTCALLAAVLVWFGASPLAAAEVVGQRPYEMDWVGRTEDTRPPQVDFEAEIPWEVHCQDAQARFERTREQQLWGKYVAKLTYRGEGKQPAVTARCSAPVPLAAEWDCVNVWVYGNNWAWAPDPATPPVTLNLVFQVPAGERRFSIGTVRWKEWFLVHHRFTPDQRQALTDGGKWIGVEVTGGTNREDRELFLDNLCFYREQLEPLTFAPRPLRGIDPFPGQSTGTNVGPDRLPFPTREQTILPDNLTSDFEVSVTRRGEQYLLRYQGSDGQLTYSLSPTTGTWSDIEAEWEDSVGKVVFRPLTEGGILLSTSQGAVPPDRLTLVSAALEADAVVTRWRAEKADITADVACTYRLWQKSLIIDVACPGGHVAEVRFGKATGLKEPRLATLPYLAGASSRPAVVVSGPPDRPLFLMGLVDHTRSNASELWFLNQVHADGAIYNGGSRYLPKTNGQRNDCFERLFLTVSPRFEEVLPNVPNPKSPWMHVAGERVWRAHGASNRDQDYALWKRVARYGMTKIALTDHETGWRDGGESFTFRTRAAPGRGGDPGQVDYARNIRALGFRYGIYNNYTDFAPVNEHWHEDMVTRTSSGEWRSAWARCYNPKPARAVEYEARLAPVIQQKFQLDTAYCDVHTAVRPWDYCDFDARVPGAGTFAATFYAYGEIMLQQKRTWNGPVYSEGNNHWYYCGLTDGNYGQDQAARLSERPWLVDFDLRKLHPLGCSFGMGNPGMFFGSDEGFGSTPEEQRRRLDQFLAATLAFGHTGFLVMEGGLENAARSYFSLQQIHARYAEATVRNIRYADEQGQLFETSAALGRDVYRRSQVVTDYDNGMEVWVNGHAADTWKTPHGDLPPFGWFARDAQRGDLLSMSAVLAGQRADYVESPAYYYADPRGRFVRFPKLACNGPMIAHRRDARTLEIIPLKGCSIMGVAADSRQATTTALDESGKVIGPASTRLSRGMLFVEPVANAFSYLVEYSAEITAALRCSRAEVVPGEKVVVTGRETHEFTVPGDAVVGSQLWQQFEDAWIDFLVRPLVDAQLDLVDGKFALTLQSHAPAAGDAVVALADRSQRARLTPGAPVTLQFDLPLPEKESTGQLPLKVQLDGLQFERSWQLTTKLAHRMFAQPSDEAQTGQCLRGGRETAVDSSCGTQANWTDMDCGDKVQHGLFMHPPYQSGVGYTFALLGPWQLPAEIPATFHCQIGKKNGSDPGDGILFRIAMVEENGQETLVAEQSWIEHAWSPMSADLSRWAGKKVRLKLIADVGRQDNSAGDWACWADMKLQSSAPLLTTTVN